MFGFFSSFGFSSAEPIAGQGRPRSICFRPLIGGRTSRNQSGAGFVFSLSIVFSFHLLVCSYVFLGGWYVGGRGHVTRVRLRKCPKRNNRRRRRSPARRSSRANREAAYLGPDRRRRPRQRRRHRTKPPPRAAPPPPPTPASNSGSTAVPSRCRSSDCASPDGSTWRTSARSAAAKNLSTVQKTKQKFHFLSPIFRVAFREKSHRASILYQRIRTRARAGALNGRGATMAFDWFQMTSYPFR